MENIANIDINGEEIYQIVKDIVIESWEAKISCR